MFKLIQPCSIEICLVVFSTLTTVWTFVGASRWLNNPCLNEHPVRTTDSDSARHRYVSYEEVRTELAFQPIFNVSDSKTRRARFSTEPQVPPVLTFIMLTIQVLDHKGEMGSTHYHRPDTIFRACIP